jgi:hypothetical protein
VMRDRASFRSAVEGEGNARKAGRSAPLPCDEVITNRPEARGA